MRGRLGLTLLLCVLGAAAPAGAVTEDNFKLQTGADLIALCDVAPSDPLFAQAIHMCQGYCVATYQTLLALGTSEKVDDFFCPTEPRPSRDEAIASFVAWAKAPGNAAHLSEVPAALLGRYLILKYPCPQPVATGGAR